MISLSDYSFSKAENRAFIAAVIAAGLVISRLMYHSMVCMVLILPFISRIRGYIVDYAIDRRKSVYMQQFKDFLFLASTSVAAGRSMTDAIDESIPGLKEIYGNDSLLAGELTVVRDRIVNNREDDVSVLMELGINSGIGDVIDFVMIYKVCRQTGADLISSLNKSSAMIIDKMTIEKEIREITKRKGVEGLFIFIMPILVILFLNLSSPDYIAPLYETIAGRIIMTAVIAADIWIYGIVDKITRIEL